MQSLMQRLHRIRSIMTKSDGSKYPLFVTALLEVLRVSKAPNDSIQSNQAGALLTNLAVPEMRKRGGGAVVFVASIAGYQGMEVVGCSELMT